MERPLTIVYRGQPVTLDPAQAVRVYYTNWKGETAWRRVVPLPVPPEFVATDWHPKPQWHLRVWDLDRSAERSYALKDIHQWTSDTPTPPDAQVAAPHRPTHNGARDVYDECAPTPGEG